MIKELNNLKVTAIAVELPEDAENFRLERKIENRDSYPALIYEMPPDFDEPPYYVKLPEVPWEILGRANELQDKEIINLMYGESYLFEETPIYEACDILWNEYCASNGLTNELILFTPPTQGNKQ